MNLVEGEIFYIDKPHGWTSFDVVKRVRGAILRRLRVKKFKVGHAGTLDPLATGVMIVCTGRATKRIEELQGGEKDYTAEIALGATTPSFDLETEVDATYPTAHITREKVEEVLARFRGTIEQVPPAYSACKIEGVRAYELARNGEAVDLRPKQLRIERLELKSFSPECITVDVTCSKGTYIRGLARDIGQALESGAHLRSLRRTRVGDVTADRCLTAHEVADLIATSPLEFPEDYPYRKDV